MTFNQFVELAVSLSVQATLVMAVVWVLSRFVRNAKAECRLWSNGYVTILFLVALGLVAPHVRLIQPWSSFGTDVVAPLVSAEIFLGRALLVIWLLGVCASGYCLLFGSIGTARFLKTCRPTDDQVSEFDSLFDDDIHQRVAPRRRPQILSSSAISGPCCWQFHRPYIVLPDYLLEMDRQDLRFVLRHEAAHLREGHPVQLFLERLVAILFWFHPVVWWASRQSALAREVACDEAAIGAPAEVRNYLRTLLAIAERSETTVDSTQPHLAFGRSSHVLALRARRLVQNAEKSCDQDRNSASSLTRVCLAVATALISLVWLPLDILASPRSHWSPWPKWSAQVLHDFDVSAPDYEVYDSRSQLHELLVEPTLHRNRLSE